MRLYEHTPHSHVPKNVKMVHEEERRAAAINQKIAVALTRFFSSMWTFWAIFLWVILWIITNATIARFDPLPWPLLLTLASVPQLPLAIVIMVGQAVISHHQELQDNEQYGMTERTFHETDQMTQHMHAQDVEILSIKQFVEQQNATLDELRTLVVQALERKPVRKGKSAKVEQQYERQDAQREEQNNG